MLVLSQRLNPGLEPKQPPPFPFVSGQSRSPYHCSDGNIQGRMDFHAHPESLLDSCSYCTISKLWVPFSRMKGCESWVAAAPLMALADVPTWHWIPLGAWRWPGDFVLAHYLIFTFQLLGRRLGRHSCACDAKPESQTFYVMMENE